MSTSPRTASALASTTATSVRRIDRPSPLWAMAAAPSTSATRPLDGISLSEDGCLVACRRRSASPAQATATMASPAHAWATAATTT
ncbi:MAG: hypothetical protein M0Z42_15915 [Actinomycetota bacterium]|nr:hypothetical protein [Actinomycetota bacterium]